MKDELFDISKFYDHENRIICKDDLSFYSEYAKKIKGNILELGCGTGRILLTLTPYGNNLFGLDKSISMLKQLKSKSLMLQDIYQSRLYLINGDMVFFSFKCKFNLIIIPFRTFQCLTSIEEQKKCLKSVHQHLSNSGTFILHVSRYLIENEFEAYRKNMEWSYCKDHLTVNRDVKIIAKNSEAGMIEFLLEYSVVLNGTKTTYSYSLKQKFFRLEEIFDLIQECGLKVIASYGYFNKINIYDGSEYIILCNK